MDKQLIKSLKRMAQRRRQAANRYVTLKLNFLYLFFFLFFKERLGLKLTHKRITTKVVLPVSKGKGAIQGEVKM